jgi:hypothetical protein
VERILVRRSQAGQSGIRAAGNGELRGLPLHGTRKVTSIAGFSVSGEVVLLLTFYVLRSILCVLLLVLSVLLLLFCVS